MIVGKETARPKTYEINNSPIMNKRPSKIQCNKMIRGNSINKIKF